jgi:hypothetical protein
MSILSEAGQKEIWKNFSAAVGAELREAKSLRGASGLDHHVQAIAIDEKGSRLILVSAEASPRIAALMQVDVQATMPNIRVVVARPVIVDVPILARRLLEPLGATSVSLAAISETAKSFNEMSEDRRKEVLFGHLSGAFAPVARAWRNAALPTFTQIMDAINQLSYVDWRTVGEKIQANSQETGIIDISLLGEIDNTKIDREHGICPIPLYEFEEADWDLLTDHKHTDDLRDRLKSLDIYQYFFPSPDQLALGLVDGGLNTEDKVISAVETAPALGHPLSQAELLPHMSHISEVVSELRRHGYVAEGEFGLEISSTGSTVRSSLKYRPREGLVSKVLNRFNINLSASPKDFFQP